MLIVFIEFCFQPLMCSGNWPPYSMSGSALLNYPGDTFDENTQLGGIGVIGRWSFRMRQHSHGACRLCGAGRFLLRRAGRAFVRGAWRFHVCRPRRPSLRRPRRRVLCRPRRGLQCRAGRCWHLPRDLRRTGFGADPVMFNALRDSLRTSSAATVRQVR